MDTLAVTSLILSLTFSLLTVEVLTTDFAAVTSSSGEKLCAVDKPSDVVLNVRSVIKCGAICKQDAICVTYSFKKDLKECNLYCTAPHNYSAVAGCSSFKLQGSRPPIQDCSDIQRAGRNVSGVATLSVNGTTIQVYCDMQTDGGGWLVFQRRVDGSINFYRNWSDYANGFGSLTGEFWLGNDILNLLTAAKRYKLRVDMSKFDGTTSYAEYDNFKVNSVADNYRLVSIGNFNGPARDSLYDSVGQQFSTYDKDNDMSNSNNCAVLVSGAWWFSDNCSSSNLNGIYYYGGQIKLDGVTWIVWTTRRYSLKTTEMKIRPV